MGERASVEVRRSNELLLWSRRGKVRPQFLGNPNSLALDYRRVENGGALKPASWNLVPEALQVQMGNLYKYASTS